MAGLPRSLRNDRMVKGFPFNNKSRSREFRGRNPRGVGGLDRPRRYMLMDMLRPPLPNLGLTTLLRVEPKEKFSPTENE